MNRNSLMQVTHRVHYGYWIATALAVIAFAWLLILWTAVPKLKATDDALKTVDALFTAINSHDSKRMTECRAKLDRYAIEGNLSKEAMSELAKCCDQAEAGDWEKAAKRLYDMIDKQ